MWNSGSWDEPIGDAQVRLHDNNNKNNNSSFNRTNNYGDYNDNRNFYR